jgi:hypothetical protein
MLWGMDKHGRDARLALLAGRQAGAFSFLQAVGVGFPRPTISRRLATGVWERLHPGVLTVAGLPRSSALERWAAVLAVGPDAVLSHETAALIHGAERLGETPITLTNPHGAHHRLDGVTVHQIDDLRAHHRTTWQGLPVSTAARAVVELGATQGAATIGRVADDLVRAGRTSYGAVASVLAEVMRRGKPGMEKVVHVLDERGDGYVPPASELERALFAALDAGGLPAPVRQLPLPGRGPIAGVADGGYLDAQVVLEADGRRWHARVEAARRDRERDAQVVRAGWVPLRFVYEQIVDDPAGVCATVAEVRATRLAQLRRAA